jgi:transposase
VQTVFLAPSRNPTALRFAEHLRIGAFGYTAESERRRLDESAGWPGYHAWRHEIDEKAKTLKLWVRRKRGNKKLICSGCGHRVDGIHEICERQVRDLPVFEFRTTVIMELYRLRRPDCRPKVERVDQLPSKAPFSKRFEDAVGQACEGASEQQVACRFRLAESTVRCIDLGYLQRWMAARPRSRLRGRWASMRSTSGRSRSS